MSKKEKRLVMDLVKVIGQALVLFSLLAVLTLGVLLFGPIV